MNRFKENPLFFFMDETYDMMPDDGFNEEGKIIEISDVGCDARTPRTSWQKIVDKLHTNNCTRRENRRENKSRNFESIGDYTRRDKNRAKEDLIGSEKMSIDVNNENLNIVSSDTRIRETSKNIEGRFKDSSIGMRERSETPYRKFGHSNRKSTRGLHNFEINGFSETKDDWIENKTRILVDKRQSLDRKDTRKLKNMRFDGFDEFMDAKENSDLSLFYDKNMYMGTATCADSLSNLSKHSNVSDASVKSRLSSASKISKNSTIFQNSTKSFDNSSKNCTTLTTKDSTVSERSNINLKKSKSEISTKDSCSLTVEEIRARRTRTKDILEPKCKYPRCDNIESHPYESKDLEPPHGIRRLVERGESPINIEIKTSSIYLRTNSVTKISRGQSPIRFSDVHPVSQYQNSATKSFFSWGNCQDNGNSVSLRSSNGKSASALRKKVSEIPRPIKNNVFGKKRDFHSNQTTNLGRIQKNRKSTTKTELLPRTEKITQKTNSSNRVVKIEKNQEDSARKNPNFKLRSLDSSAPEVKASFERIDCTKEKKVEISSAKSNISKTHEEKKVPIRICQGKNMVLENCKKSKIPASTPHERTKPEMSHEDSAKIPEIVENLVRTKSTKNDETNKTYNKDKTKNIEIDAVPIMERDTIESFSFTSKSKIPTYNTLRKVHEDSHELKIKKEYINDQSKSTLWNPEYEDAFLKGRAVGMKVIKMAKAARDERKRVYVNHGFDDYKKRPGDTSQEILDIGMTVIENVLQSPEEFLSAKTSEELLEDHSNYDSANDWSPRNSNETFWFI